MPRRRSPAMGMLRWILEVEGQWSGLRWVRQPCGGRCHACSACDNRRMTAFAIDQADVTGTIGALWIFPIKSCAGIAVQQARLLPTGPNSPRVKASCCALPPAVLMGERSRLTRCAAAHGAKC